MKTYKIILRVAHGVLEVREDTCQARNAEEAQKIFEERHGVELIVAGPLPVSN